jgi:flagellar hook-length control protein FliK
MEQLSGVSGFFYGNSQTCVTGFSREALDSALPALEFAIPDVNGNAVRSQVLNEGQGHGQHQGQGQDLGQSQG